MKFLSLCCLEQKLQHLEVISVGGRLTIERLGAGLQALCAAEKSAFILMSVRDPHDVFHQGEKGVWSEQHGL